MSTLVQHPPSSMSAVRRESRSKKRRDVSSPYGRPQQAKNSSSWSISKFLGFINPLRFRYTSYEEENSYSDEEEETEAEAVAEDQQSPLASSQSRSHSSGSECVEETGAVFHTSPAARLTARGRKLAQNINSDRQQPTASSSSTGSNSFRLPDFSRSSLSPSKTIEEVANYLNSSPNNGIPAEAAHGLANVLNSLRSEQIILPRSRSATPTNHVHSAPLSPRKTLMRNPNGVYRWEGGGSSRIQRSKNRYSSPSFGRTPEKIIMKDTTSTENVQTDTKRRKLDSQDAATSSPTLFPTPTGVLRSPAPDPSPTRVAQARGYSFPVSNMNDSNAASSSNPISASQSDPVLNGVKPKVKGFTMSTSAPKFRSTALPPRPSTPAVPSPLSQVAFRQSPSSSSSSLADSPPAKTRKSGQTETAALISKALEDDMKKTTESPKPSYQNPYDTSFNKTITRPKRARVAVRPLPYKKTKEVVTPAEKPKEISASALIEATVPKGIKRAVPPAHLKKSSAEAAARPQTKLASRVSIFEEEEEDSDNNSEEPSSKKVKRDNKDTSVTTNGSSYSSSNKKGPITVASPPTAPTSSSFFSIPTSAPIARPIINNVPSTLPKKPSTLRHSIVLEAPEPSTLLPPPRETKQLTISPQFAIPHESIFSSASSSTPVSAVKSAVSKIPAPFLPVFTFTFKSTSIPSSAIANTVKDVPMLSVPTFIFGSNLKGAL